MKAPPLPLLVAGVAALVAGVGAAVALAVGGKSSTGSAGPGSSPSTTHGAIPFDDLTRYIYALWQLEELYRDELRSFWDKPKLRRLVIQAAKFYDIDPRLIWGMTWRESGGHKAVGVYLGKYGPQKAIDKRSSAYGMGQFLRQRFESERKLAPARFPWHHQDLLDPRVSMWSVAASIKRAYEKYGREPSSLELGRWWAGTLNKEGAARKAGDILEHGPDVYNDVADGSKVPWKMPLGTRGVS